MTATAFLEPGEPAPARALRPEGRSPFVLTADHAGNLFPRRLGFLGVPELERQRHIAWDIGIAGVCEHMSSLMDAACVLQTYSRLVIDCNRHPSWDSAMPAVSEFTEIPGNRDLTESDRGARVAAVFQPYHGRIASLLDARAARGQRSIVVAMHSFTPVFRNERRAVEVGVLYWRKTRLAEVMLDLLRAEGGLNVGENEPYALTQDSDYSIPTHAEGRALEHVEIEIRQDLIADAAGQTAWGDRFARLLTEALARLG